MTLLLLVEGEEITTIEVKEKYQGLVRRCHNKSLNGEPSPDIDRLFDLLGGEGTNAMKNQSELGEIVEYSPTDVEIGGREVFWFFYN